MEQNMEFGHNLEHLFNSFGADDYENDDDGAIDFEGLDSFLWSSEFPTFFYFSILLVLMVVVVVLMVMIMEIVMIFSLSLL